MNDDSDFIDDEPADTRGPMHDASDEDYGRWAERYDDLNGAPDGPDDY